MATLDPRFYCTSDVDTYYVDNASGLPMSGGIVTFYSDVNRTVLKPVYQLTGTPGNYTFAPLNDPCTLSSSGTFQDGLGNNIVPYYYPFTGTPAQNTGVQELYYITVVNSGFVPQLVRQAWPPAVAQNNVTPVTDEQIDNFIPNGQFLAHTSPTSVTEPPITQLTFAGPQTIDIQPIAQGGWYFAYTDSNMATFTNSFSQIPSSGGWGSVNYPKYVFNFVCKTFDATAKTRDLWITWPDINKFSSNPGPYTLYFDARSNDGNSYVFSLYQVYYFGSGSVSPGIFSTNPIATITIGPGATLVSQNIQNITWLTNQGTIGPNGDDFVGLALRGPASGWNVSVSDFVLAEGNETFLSFPVQTNDQMLSRGVAGFMPTPNPNGSDLYLPPILTPKGMIFDHSEIGNIIAKTSLTSFTNHISTTTNELLCDGTQYQSNGYSPLGIPYSRLSAALFDPSSGLPIFGTGVNWVNTYSSSGAHQLIFITNKTGSQTAPADSAGGTATGFTFNLNSNAGTSGYNYKAYTSSGNIVTVISTFTNGTHSALGVGVGTSGMTVGNYVSTNETTTYFVFQVTALSASVLSNTGGAGLYFTFSNHTIDYYMWFFVSNETDPAPGGTGIKCQLTSTMSAQDVAATIAAVITGFQVNPVTITGQPTNGAGSYFTFNSNGVQTAVWYKVAGAGTSPAIASNVMVALTGSENANGVAVATQTAINSAFFATPNLQGIFLRGWDATPIWDLDVTQRFSPDAFLSPGSVGTFEFSQYITHQHNIVGQSVPFTTTGTNVNELGGSGYNQNTQLSGGTENRPINMFVAYAIKY